MPDVAPNELHEDSMIRLCVAAHADSLGEYKAKAIHGFAAGPGMRHLTPYLIYLKSSSSRGYIDGTPPNHRTLLCRLVLHDYFA
jgi:hypothetical protein